MLKKHGLSLALVAFASSGVALAQSDAAEEIDVAIAEWNAAQEAFQAELEGIPRAERRAYYAEHAPPAAEWSDRLIDLAASVEGTPAELKALAWVARNDGRGENGATALAGLAARHASAPETGEALQAIPVSKDTKASFEHVLASSESHENKGHAAHGLANHAKTLYDLGVFYSGPYSEEFEEYYEQAYGEDVCALAKEKGWKPFAKEALEHFRAVAADHGDLMGRRGTYGDLAEKAIFELENLTPGSIVPDIVAADLDGVEFKLSDYRGKVVVLDFWGDW